ncbi:hypothetical protein FF041_05530 [Streptomyces jumonjinensis]|uniref:Uncharacterized protein n=1 Tax=Streptomyces jumonjinensis TaxID=1945 RepID=A0A646KC68_STRJU|nr:hypothetical protein [Streptomyces jumonjinensis]
MRCCSSSAFSSAAAASAAVMPVARRRTAVRPTFAQSIGRRGGVVPGAGMCGRRRDQGRGVLTRASQSSRRYRREFRLPRRVRKPRKDL